MSKKLRNLIVVFGVATMTAFASAPAISALPFFGSDDEKIPSLAPMLEDATPAVVSIAVEGTQQARQQVPEMFRYFFGAPNEQVQERPFRGLGSGVIIDAEKGYVVTNNHVVDNADNITVKLTDGREFEAKKLGSDPQSDIALLQIEGEDLRALPLSDSDDLRVGDFAIAIGNPFGLSQTVTSGIVSALGRSGLNIGGYEDFIQTDAAINRGNSGGALVNLKGELIGINTAIFGPGGGNVGIGFAIPSNMMKSLVDQIIEFGEVRRGLLGILGSNIDAGLAEAMESNVNKGAFINEVTPDSAAEKADLQPGDIIIALNDRDLSSFEELRAKVASLGAGAEIELTIIRKGEEITKQVTLGDAGATVASAKDIHPALEGATLSNGQDNAGNRGIEVAEIEARSPATRIGLQEGDVIVGVNRERVSNIVEFTNVIEDAKGVIALNVKRGNSTLYLVIR